MSGCVWRCIVGVYGECLRGVRGWQVDVLGLSVVFGGVFLGFLVLFWDCLRCVCYCYFCL